MKILSEFCSEYGFEESLFRRSNGDLIIQDSGAEYVDDERYFQELTVRGKPLSRKKRGRKKLPRTTGGRRIWQSNNRGQIKSFINRKTKQITRLKAEISDLQIRMGDSTSPDPDLEYGLNTLRLDLYDAEIDLKKAQDRYDELLAKRKEEVEKKTH